MAKEFTKEDEALLAELGVESESVEASSHTPLEERVIAGFEEVHRFVEAHDRLPEHGESKDIFERLYAVRLDRIRRRTEFHQLLKPLDILGILESGALPAPEEIAPDASDEELLEALGVDPSSAADVSKLTHVRSRSEIKAAEEVAQRTACEDFEAFRPLFEQVQQEIATGQRKTVKYQDNAAIERGDMFIIEGQKVLVADMEKEFVTEYERKNRRLRVVYDNGTESDLLLRSLQRALNKDSKSRRILPPESMVPPLFSGEESDGDAEVGHIYVLRSLSDHPFIAENREVIHKIGVTGGDVNKRINNARKDPTFLLADVELVESYRLANINRAKLERILHQFLGAARMDVQLRDRFGGRVEPREWFLVPLPIIRQIIEILKDGHLEHCVYDAANAQIVDTRTK